MTKKLFGICFLLIFSSCGGSNGNSDAFNRQNEVNPEPDTLQRIFRADLRAVNPSVVNRVEGQVVVRLVEDTFQVNLAVQNVPAATHPQHIRNGKSCPTMAADTNKDGLVSLAEAEVVTGGVFIPLDSDLANVSEDARSFPDGGFLKAYVYQEEASRSRLLSDLGPGADFDLGNRVILVLGTDDDPTLPIACAELTQVTGQP